MKAGKKMFQLLVLSLLVSLLAGTAPAQSQDPAPPKLVVFESVGSVE